MADDLRADLRAALLAVRRGLAAPSQLQQAGEEWLDRPGVSLSRLLADLAGLTDEERSELTASAAAVGDTEPGPGATPGGGGGPPTAADPGETVSLATAVHVPTAADGATAAYDHDAGGGPGGGGPGVEPPGRYELVERHAVGGLGQVWRARDLHLGRVVALKEVRPDRAGRASLTQRFLDEARVHSQLEHPNIVPVYDLEEAGAGGPFYTMRFVAGKTLGAAAEAYHKQVGAGGLELRELLGAFVSVCQAVAYAHSRGVLHRDLKGQNVLLGPYGEVFLLDWGLAKVLDRGESAEGGEASGVESGLREETSPGQVIGTPEYMAPEQASGLPADRRSDVYGLGAVLYKILTGKAPYPGGKVAEVLARVTAGPPPRPREVALGVDRALEAVCLKAMARDPADRYASAAALADDVRRWLADEPVTAHRDPWDRRLARWARRHRAPVAAAVGLLITGVVALAVTDVLLRAERDRTRAERDNAKKAREAAEANFNLARESVDELYAANSELRLPHVPAAEAYRADVAVQILSYYDKFMELAPDSSDVRLGASAAYHRAGATLRQTGRYAEAERALARGAAIIEEAEGPEPDAPSFRLRLAQVRAEQGVTYRLRGRFAEAEPRLRGALALVEPLLKQNPNDQRYAQAASVAGLTLAAVLRQTGRDAEALEAALRAVDLAKRGAAVRTREDALVPLLAGSQPSSIYRTLGRHAEARAAARAHVEATRAALLQYRGDNDRRMILADGLDDLGRALAEGPGADRDAATVAFAEAVALLAELTREFPRLLTYRDALAKVHLSRAALDEDGSGDPGAAAFEALALAEGLLAEAPGHAGYEALRARALAALARRDLTRGDAAAARRRLDAAAESAEVAREANPGSTDLRDLLRRIEADRARAGQGA